MFSLYVELSAPHILRQTSAYSADCYILRAYCSPINTTPNGSFICNKKLQNYTTPGSSLA